MNLLPTQTPQQHQQREGTSALFEKIVPIIGASVVILLPYFHLGFLYSYWDVNKTPVDTDRCRCDCWDTLFKGKYEQGVARYKHVYFNLTSGTFVIWAWTVVYAFALYESVCYLLRLQFSGHLRLSMLAAFLGSLYPHYYGWWMYFNYTNDGYYKQWNHQTFFSSTEILSSAVVLYLCDARRTRAVPRYLLVVIGVAVLHIMAASQDQFVTNVIMGSGHFYQIFRDIGFMLPDLLNVALPLCLWLQWCRQSGVTFSQSIKKSEFLTACLSVGVLLIICSKL